jgi:transcriptional regulator with XRE-family HTH domain
VSTGSRRLPGKFGKAVAALLADAVLEQGLTQKALGKLVGISQAQLSTQLRGERPITVDEMYDICNALGLTTSDIVRLAEG